MIDRDNLRERVLDLKAWFERIDWKSAEGRRVMLVGIGGLVAFVLLLFAIGAWWPSSSDTIQETRVERRFRNQVEDLVDQLHEDEDLRMVQVAVTTLGDGEEGVRVVGYVHSEEARASVLERVGALASGRDVQDQLMIVEKTPTSDRPPSRSGG